MNIISRSILGFAAGRQQPAATMEFNAVCGFSLVLL